MADFGHDGVVLVEVLGAVEDHAVPDHGVQGGEEGGGGPGDVFNARLGDVHDGGVRHNQGHYSPVVGNTHRS